MTPPTQRPVMLGHVIVGNSPRLSAPPSGGLNSTLPLASEHPIDHGADAVERRLPVGNGQLRRRLVGSDIVALLLGWGIGLLVPGLLMNETGPVLAGNAMWVVVGVTVSLVAIRTQQLYLTRVCAVRTIEIQRLMRASALGGLGVFFLAQSLDQNVSFERMIIASTIAFSALVANRSVYRSRLRAARRVGRHVRPMIMIGDNEEAAELVQVTREHPETGVRVVGVLSSSGGSGETDVPYLGSPADAFEALRRTHASGAIVVASALPAAQLNPLTRRLVDAGIHVHISSGLKGIAHHRIRPVPLAHEPLLYLEQVVLSPWQLVVKRGIDLLGASVALLLTLPLLAVAACAIWLEDRGPVVFRQERVGVRGRRFEVLKLRTMVVGAEARLSEVQELNDRHNGPLFKADTDPRITRVGQLLRATSIDELPQLINVLRGTMSLVGPRPALPSEAAEFDAELSSRTQVRPGITGLWQVEARDNAAFNAYRRLDLFYIENWSIGFDLSILVATGAAVVGRAFRALPRQRALPQSAATSSGNPAVQRVGETLAGLHNNRNSTVSTMTWLNHWSAQRVIADPTAEQASGRLTLVGVDGVALRRLLRGRPERTSADLVLPDLLPRLARPRMAVVGAARATNRAAADKLLAMTSDGTLVGALDGYEELPGSFEAVRNWALSIEPTVVIIGLGAGLQDWFAEAVAAGMQGGIVLTCGGYLDQVVRTHYYPKWAYPLRLNWLVRLAREPGRLWRRYTVDAARAVLRRGALNAMFDALPGYSRYMRLFAGPHTTA